MLALYSGSCVAPLRLGGRSRVPLAFGWEVPVSLLRSASGRRKERGTQHGGRTSSEAGEWLRYDFNSGKNLIIEG
jgi:hypothetical protein